MAEPFPSLTIYRLRDEINSRRVSQLEDYIDTEKKTTSYSLQKRYDFNARLFISPPDIGPPSWREPLKSGFGDLNEIPDAVSNSAVLIITVKSTRRDLHFASTFGFGRFLLCPGSFERNYGMRVALNVIYPKPSGVQLNRVRSVDSKTVGANTLRTRRQVDRLADFETFDIDIERDLLNGLTGTPLDTETWGKRIDGSDALHLHRPTSFEDLGRICLKVDEHSKKIPREFSWVDKIFAVRDSALIESLRNRLVEMIKSRQTGTLELAPPELVDWGDIEHFKFSFDADYLFDEPSIEDYVSCLESLGKLSSLTLNQLISGHRLLAVNAAGLQIGSWTALRSLSGEVEHRSSTYTISEGEFFEVSPSYLSDLDGAIRKIKKFDGLLPESRPKWSEDQYNKAASQASNRLLLDKHTVRLASRTTPIEVCDVLTSHKDLIHVKRKLNSSSLSHLFSQGLVSADLLLMSEEFRKKVRQCIGPLEKARRLGQRFSRLFPAGRGITAHEFTVVYGIIANWKGKTLPQALPLFSKVNLRRCIHDLNRMGYRVAYRQISETVKGTTV